MAQTDEFLTINNLLSMEPGDDDGASIADEILNKTKPDVLQTDQTDEEGTDPAEDGEEGGDAGAGSRGSSSGGGADAGRADIGDPDNDDGGGDPGDDAGEPGDDGGGNLYDSLQQRHGYEVEGEFEEDLDGLSDYIDKLSEKKADEILQAKLEKYPQAKQLIDFMENGGAFETFMQAASPQEDYSRIEIQPENSSQHKQIIKHYLESKGVDEDTVVNMVSVLEDQDKLESAAKRYLGELQTEQQDKQQQLIDTQKQQAKLQQEEAQRSWEETQTLVQQGNLGGFTIPEKNRKKFIDWMSKPVDRKGTTQRMLDSSKLSREQLLQLEYFIFKGFDLKDEITKGVARSKVNSTLSRISGKGNKLKGGSSDAGNAGGAREPIKDINSILGSV